MNIKNLSLVILSVSLFSFGFVAFAQSQEIATGTASSAAVTSTAQRMQAARNFAMKMGNRFDVNLRTLTSLSSRVSNRINKLVEQGADMTEAKAKLNGANLKIQEAKDSLVSLQQGIESAIVSAQPKKAFAAIKVNSIKGVMDKIKAAHKALVDTIVILQKTAKSQNVTATSTPATSTPSI